MQWTRWARNRIIARRLGCPVRMVECTPGLRRIMPHVYSGGGVTITRWMVVCGDERMTHDEYMERMCRG